MDSLLSHEDNLQLLCQVNLQAKLNSVQKVFLKDENENLMAHGIFGLIQSLKS